PTCGTRYYRWAGDDWALQYAEEHGGHAIERHVPPTVLSKESLDEFVKSRYEGDLQQAALRFGWKVKRWVEHAGMVPVFVPREGRWYRLARSVARREHVTHAEAMRMMRE
ncbi:hypothetical protein IAE22_33140, partial [Bacillus sp. S34]|nr:hypothetical protein [Bacillus sp. S34]